MLYYIKWQEYRDCSKVGCCFVSSLVTHGLKENGSSSTIEEIDCKALLGRDICESSSGLDPTESDRIGEEQGSALCAGEPVTSARGDASERSASSAVVTSKQVACLFVPKIEVRVWFYPRPLGGIELPAFFLDFLTPA